MSRPHELGDAVVDPQTAAAMLDHIRDAVLLVAASQESVRIVYANQAFGELRGQAADTLLGAELAELSSTETDPGDLARLAWGVQHSETVQAVLVLEGPDGSPRWVEVDVAPLEQAGEAAYSVAVLRETTEKIRCERLLAAAGRWAHDLLAIVDAGGRMGDLVRPPVLGHDAGEIVGRSIVDLTHPDDVCALRSLAAPDVGEPPMVRLAATPPPATSSPTPHRPTSLCAIASSCDVTGLSCRERHAAVRRPRRFGDRRAR